MGVLQASYITRMHHLPNKSYKPRFVTESIFTLDLRALAHYFNAACLQRNASGWELSLGSPKTITNTISRVYRAEGPLTSFSYLKDSSKKTTLQQCVYTEESSQYY